ncbi:hypothetical protein NW767_015075 [Fusarium falciforme]|uniref:MULE transposase domain-containing protein n=1 Tax=Fusarium falciforme TaxID=195108 RepID=A0A9W8QTD1_9HYPO|nr:hypothetical protein NW755_014457 [Fusarium falciforme]KAJ4177614.1 hypothetical protein NW767_015075 [Fusarium falciforme]
MAQQLGKEDDLLYPHFIITDDAAAAHVGTKKLFPNTQMQLCIWHICTNVLKAVNERWIGEKEQQNLPFDDWHALSKKPASDAHPRGKQVTQKDFLRSWKLVMYAKTTEDLRARWRDFRT